MDEAAIVNAATDHLRKIAEGNAERQVFTSDVDRAAAIELAIVVGLTVERRAENQPLHDALHKIADLGSCANGKTPAYKLFQQAIDIATSAL